MADEWTIDPVAPPAEPPPGLLEDAAKSAAAQGTLGPGDVVGLPGTIGQGIQSGVKWLARKGMGAANYFGADLPVDQIMSDVDRGLLETLTPEERKQVEAGNAIPSAEMGTLPTAQGVEEAVKAKVPYTNYEGKTAPGRITGDAARFATGNAIVGPMNPLAIAGRTVEGIAAGGGSGAAGEWAKAAGAPEYETVARFAGALAAPLAGKSVLKLAKPWAMPRQFADDTAMRLLAEDMRNGQSAMSLEDINAATANGANPSIIDMAGPRTRKWLAERYGQSGQEALRLNDMLDARATESSARIRDFINRNNRGVADLSVEDQAAQAAKVEEKRLYDLTKTDPRAHAVWTPELEAMASQPGPLADAMAKVKKDFLAGNIPASWGVNIPTGGLPPNLAYWDAVKKALGDRINAAKPSALTASSADTALFNTATEQQRKLLSTLDNIVPGYATARDSHSELLGVRTAPEAGEKFGKMTATRDTQEALGVFDAYNPEQKELFRRGLLRSFYDQLGTPTGKASTLFKRLTADGTADGYRHVLGDREYERLVGNLSAEDVMSKAKAINEAGSRPGFWTMEGGKAAITLGVGQLASYLSHGEVGAMNGPAVASAALAAAKLSKDVAMNYAERRIAPRVFQLMRSSHPDDMTRLGNLIASNPDAGSLVRKISDTFGNVPLKAVQSQQTTDHTDGWSIDPAPENYDAVPNGLKSGGRVARKAGGRIGSNPISAEVKKVRALLSHKTATMLSMPDDAVATALHIAKGQP
jgi:hypothetical protein